MPLPSRPHPRMYRNGGTPTVPLEWIFLQLRIPTLIRDRIRVRAEKERRSVNSTSLLMLEEAMAANRSAYHRPPHKRRDADAAAREVDARAAAPERKTNAKRRVNAGSRKDLS